MKIYKKSFHSKIKNGVKNVVSKFETDSLKTLSLRVYTVLKNNVSRKTRLKFRVRNFYVNCLLTFNRQCQAYTISLMGTPSSRVRIINPHRPTRFPLWDFAKRISSCIVPYGFLCRPPCPLWVPAHGISSHILLCKSPCGKFLPMLIHIGFYVGSRRFLCISHGFPYNPMRKPI